MINIVSVDKTRPLLYVCLWIFLSALVILYNKYILSVYNFNFPILLTMIHMSVSTILATIAIKSNLVDSIELDSHNYIYGVLPIALLFSGTLSLGNSAYQYLSVSFIQMLKALSPVTVYLIGCTLKTETFHSTLLVVVCIVSMGICIASYGELALNYIGLTLQLSSVLVESTRITLIQILLQSRGLKLNSITTLYYVAPASLICLTIPFCIFELPNVLVTDMTLFNPLILLTNALAAFALNLSVFLLIGQTSALTMNIAGVVKDWMLIALSVVLFGSPVSTLNLVGYSVAFIGVCLYNYHKTKFIN